MSSFPFTQSSFNDELDDDELSAFFSKEEMYVVVKAPAKVPKIRGTTKKPPTPGPTTRLRAKKRTETNRIVTRNSNKRKKEVPPDTYPPVAKKTKVTKKKPIDLR